MSNFNSDTIDVKNLSMVYKYSAINENASNRFAKLFAKIKKEKKALDSINFSISKGNIVGYVGLNGAGKTTTIKILSGIMKPSSGEVTVLGYNPFEKKEDFLKKISIIMGSKSQLIWDLPAIDSIEFNKKIYEVDEKRYKKYLDMMVDILNVSEILNKQVRCLSLGERMKIELIAALIHQPKVIFLDEPTIGLDIISQENIRTFLKNINSEWNSTIILTSHNIDDISEVCNGLLLIDQGKLCYSGELSKFIQEYGGKVVKLTVVDKQDEIIHEILNKHMKIAEVIRNQIVLEINDSLSLNNIKNLWGDFSNEITDVSIENKELKDLITCEINSLII